MNHSTDRERIDRITRMEQALDESAEAVSALGEALKQYLDILPALKELTEYYSSPLWREDFEADEAGLLPRGLKRGVLSEDGVWNLLYDHRQLMEELKLLAHTHEKK